MIEMKYSGEEWINDIPGDWLISKIGTLYSVRNTKVSDRDYQPLSVTMKGVLPQLETAAKTDAHDDRKLVKKGDFAINSRSDRRGACGIAESDGSVSLINTILCPRNEMDPKYYNWLFHTSQFADEYYRWGHGIVDDLWTTRWQEMKNISIPVPSLLEQKAIATFLDNRISKIDSLIANQEQPLGKLKQYKQSLITEVVTKGLDRNVAMKESGVDWIGEVPKEWKLEKIKYVAIIRDEKYEGGDYEYIALENVESLSGRYVKTDSTYDLEGTKLAYSGDVIFGKLRPYLGKALSIDYECCVSTEFAVFSPKKLASEYLKYVLLSSGFIEIINASTYGTKMPRANVDFIKNVIVPIPTKKEQDDIVAEAIRIDNSLQRLIDIKLSKIEKLNQYKKSLIYEYVTGKKRVPEA